MNIHHVLFLCFLSALCGGHSGLVSAKLYIFAGAEGGNGSIRCSFSQSGTKFFCKDECKAEDILIKTDEVRAQSDRYSTEYTQESNGKGRLSMTMTHLTKSDSGRFRLGLGGNLVPDSYCEFEIRVLDATKLDVSSRFSRADVEGENITYGCLDTVYGRQKFLCRNECTKEEDILIETNENTAQNGRYSIEYREGSWYGLYVTITRATKSDSGWYKCGYGRASSPDSYYTNTVIVIEASLPSASTPTTTSSSSGSFTPSSVFPETSNQSGAVHTSPIWPLVVCVPLVLVLLAGFLLLLYKWKKRRNTGLNTTGNADDINMEPSAIYENCPPASTCQDSIYENIQQVSKNPKRTY